MPVAVAGRLVVIRDMGKSQFVKILDQQGQIQLYVKKDVRVAVGSVPVPPVGSGAYAASLAAGVRLTGGVGGQPSRGVAGPGILGCVGGTGVHRERTVSRRVRVGRISSASR